jgi:hypothetical protein
MKKGAVIPEIRQVWEVRANGLPRLLVEASTKSEAEARYRERFRILAPDIQWMELAPCQRQQKTSE